MPMRGDGKDAALRSSGRPRRALAAAAGVLCAVAGLWATAPAALGADDGRIAGRVVRASDGAGVGDPLVQLHRFSMATGAWQLFAAIRADADGRYEFGGLAAGRYRLCARSDAGIGPANPSPLYLPRCWRTAPDVDSADEVELGPGEVVRGLRIRLATRGLIRGTVTDPGGAPLASGYAQAFWRESGNWTAGPYATLDADGRYELRVEGDHVFHVCFQPSEVDGYALECWSGAPSLPSSDAVGRVRPGRSIDGIDLSLEPGGRISGLISGYPTGTQGGVAIVAFRNDGGEWYPAGSTVVEPFTSPNPFELATLPPGTYRACFTSQDFEFFPVFADDCVGGPTPATGSDIDVVAGATTAGADVEVDSASTIRGKVNGISAPVPVQLLTGSGAPVAQRLTAANGSYGFSGLPDGSYRVAFNRADGETRLAARFYRNVPEEAGVGAALPVVLSDGDLVQGISSGLVAGGSITGRLVDPGGVGIADCELRAYTADGSLVTRSSRSGADGSFDVGGLSTGSYRLLVSARTCGLGRASLHLDTGPPPRLVGDPARADPLPVVVGSPTAVAGDLVITQPRNGGRAGR